VFSMTDGLPDRESIEAGASVIDGGWPQVSAVLSDLDDKVRSLAAHGQVSDLDIRRARRESRRVLRDNRPDLGLCESCRKAPAVRRVSFADGVVFAVCPPCAAGAVAGVAA
jgi:hypothetical protein